MVKPRLTSLYPQPPRKYSRWWRGLLGALLTFLIIVPYMMGGDVEKYLRRWLSALNQGNPRFHVELVHYQRHWFSSDSEVKISGVPLREPLTLHLKAYHGPLFFNAGHGIRLGLTLLQGTVDSNKLLGQQETIKFAGPIALTAFVPYFKDRELHTEFPVITIRDKQNKLMYTFNTLKGYIDGDGSLQMQVPSLKVSYLDGTEAANMNDGILRILPRSHLASFSAKQIDIYRKNNNTLTISNFILQANTPVNSSNQNTSTVDLSVHADQLQRLALPSLNAQPLNLGPFEFKLNISGLHMEGVFVILEMLKTMIMQQTDLSIEQGEKLEKAWSSIFAADTAYELGTQLATQSGQLKAQFRGGFNFKAATNPLKDNSELLDAFYSKGSIELSADLKDALSQYTASKPRDPENLPSNEEIAVIALLGFLKPAGENYAAQVNIHHGRIILNGKDVNVAG